MLTELMTDLGPPCTWLMLMVVLVLLGVMYTRTKSVTYEYPLPPSPGIALPIIGHIYLLPQNPRKKMMEWAKRLGPIYRLQFGSEQVVVLNGYDVLREVLVGHADAFSSRPGTYVMKALGKDRGFVTSGPHWSQQRKVTMQIFRHLGFGSPIMEDKVQTEVTFFLDMLDLKKGAPFDPRDLTMQSISNVISRLVFGKSFRHDNPHMAQCARLIGEQVSLMEGLAVLNFLPFLGCLPGDLFGLKKAVRIADQLENSLIRHQMEMRKRQGAFREGDVEDYITGYLREIHRRQGGDSTDQEDTAITEENLVAVVANLFAAGTETTSTTIRWSILYLLHNPEVKDRCFQEIVASIGLDRRPSAQDRYRCPYLEAFIMEVQRISSIAAFALFHVASETVVIRDLVIPRGSIVMPSLDSVLLSDQVWGDASCFRPERFLDSNSNQLVKRPELIPYSLGRRACLGEALAKMELFLFVTSILQKFDIVLPDGADLPPLTDRFGLSCSPLPFDVCFVPRHKPAGSRMESG